jgi:crossover junction endodeoxyribonuclease RusA
MKITLPWPPSILSPNARAHWARKDAPRKKYKGDCYLLAWAKKPELPEGKIPLKITFCPPDRRKRDMDNMLSSIKAGLDGISQAWGVDDSRFRPILDIGDVVKHGAVVVEVV